MIATTSYPLLDVFFTMLIFIGLCIWFGMVIVVFIDIFRSHDLGGLAKAAWFLFVFFVPLVGLLAYLIVRGRGMSGRSTSNVYRQSQQNVVLEPADATTSAPGTATTTDGMRSASRQP
jgi:membrane protein implicated in regulation of membrane protease activity